MTFHYDGSLHNNYIFHSGATKDYKTTSAMKDDQKLYVIKQLFARILLQIRATLLDTALDQYSFVIMCRVMSLTCCKHHLESNIKNNLFLLLKQVG